MSITTVMNSLGYAGSIGIGCSLIPQVIKTLKTRDITGLSVYWLGLAGVSGGCMICYATFFQVYPMLITNIAVLLNTLVLLYVYFIEN